MRMLQHAAHWKDIWYFLRKSLCHSILFFKDLRKKVCEACLFIGYVYAIIQKMFFACQIPDQKFSFFTKRERYYPHTLVG